MKRRNRSSGGNPAPGIVEPDWSKRGGDGFFTAENLFGARSASGTSGQPADGALKLDFDAPGTGAKEVSVFGTGYRVRLDSACLFAALFFGLAGLAGGMFAYAYSTLPAILRIGIAAAAASGMALLGAAVSALSTGRQKLRGGLAVLLSFVVLFGAGALLQFLYGLGGGWVAAPVDDYIFVIDDSGSMETTDPDQKRLTALTYLLNNLDSGKRAALVCFTSEITGEVPLGALDRAKIGDILGVGENLTSDGGTDIHLGVSHALNMDGVCDPTRSALIVLLTDGLSGSDIRASELAHVCAAGNVRISTIGLTDNVDKAVLRMLAGMTGGAYYQTDELDDLIDIYSRINVIDESRDLIGVRTGVAHASLPYAALRALCWALIGLIAGLAGRWIFRSSEKPLLLPVAGALCGLLSGALLEAGSRLWWESPIVQGLMLIPLCLVFLFYRKYERKSIAAAAPGGAGGGNRFTFAESPADSLDKNPDSQNYNQLR